jgi:N,N-dimethylformamidase beta subunit-like, C-terminal
MEQQKKILKIGIVKPTFTGAAYSGLYNYSAGFYAFFFSPYLNHSVSAADADYYNYLPYPPPPADNNHRRNTKAFQRYFSKDIIAKAGKLGKQTFVPITDHLEMLSPKIPTTPEEIKHLDEMNPLGELYNPYRITKIVPHIKELLPDAEVVILTDGDIHDGQAISNGGGGGGSDSDGFDILILGHNEYVTQQEYDNLKNFVANGGILICLDGNVLYCEVKYNKDAQTVTLVRGHRWVFDGQKAYWYKPEMYFEDSGERWQQETSEWLGSNYAYFADIHGHKEGFAYCLSNRLIDMFEYIPLEDQYITNYDGVKIIQDWRAKSITDVPLIYGDIQIACYEKPYGKGKSIVFGIYSDMVIDNPEFLKFFDGVLLGNAIASLAPISKTCGLSYIIQKTLDGKANTINQLLNGLERFIIIYLKKDAELKRAVKDVEILQNINLGHQKTIEEKDAELKRAVKDVEILQNINLGHQKEIGEKDKLIEQLDSQLKRGEIIDNATK